MTAGYPNSVATMEFHVVLLTVSVQCELLTCVCCDANRLVHGVRSSNTGCEYSVY